MSGYIVRKSAKTDLEQIAAYTERTWGTRQRYDYLARLRRRFEDAALHPHRGSRCDHIRKGYLSIREGRHIIFYRKTGDHTGNHPGDQIEIIRILHESRDLERALQPFSPGS